VGLPARLQLTGRLMQRAVQSTPGKQLQDLRFYGGTEGMLLRRMQRFWTPSIRCVVTCCSVCVQWIVQLV